MSKKRLFVTGSTFPRWEGDTEPRFVLDLCKALTPYYDVTALMPMAPGAKVEEVLEGVKVKRFHYFPIHKWETLCYPGAIVPRIKQKKIRALLVPFLMLSLYHNLYKYKKDYDFVHAHWFVPQGIVQSFVKKPFIVTGHGGDVTSLNNGLFKKLKKRVLKKAKGITFVSQQLEDYLYDFFPEDRENFKKKTEVISMGVNCSEFSPSYRIENYFNQENKKVVLFVGRLAEVKGVKYLIESMKDVDAKLVIVGSGPLEAQLKKQAETLRNKVEFLGPKTHKELKTIYASADIFVMPSITASDGGKEGFGLVILEAMASGLPVVASDSGGIPTIVENNYNGFLVEEKSSRALSCAINKILKSPEKEKKEMKIRVIETANKYSYEEIGKKYFKFMEKYK
ncbi:glycosyltransferase family 4 protein [uncultured Dubosiella sp.]|uniref:glycosyltransferase family 4 protein n=4 Tax=uncultured Dubosiella sp. TaxID=1937011 RepID=UPI0026372FA7|nr:glycosyltransferase family 4 protein [uncultured Dubosiella sp.]